MKKILVKVALVSALVSSAQAGAVLDLEIGGGMWAAGAPTGDITTNGTNIDLAKTTQLESSTNMYMWAVVDHLIPVVPNLRIERTVLKSTGTRNEAINIANVINVTSQLNTELDLSNTDFIAYWGVPFGTWLPFIDELDFGLGAKVINGSIDMVDNTGLIKYNETFNAGIPYGYAKLRIEPPMMFGIGLEGELKYLALDVGSLTTNFTEYIVKADWGMMFPLPILDIKPGVEVGYRNMSLDVDVGSALKADIGFSGIFFGAYAKFGI